MLRHFFRQVLFPLRVNRPVAHRPPLMNASFQLLVLVLYEFTHHVSLLIGLGVALFEDSSDLAFRFMASLVDSVLCLFFFVD